jgi:hypothetical protein
MDLLLKKNSGALHRESLCRSDQREIVYRELYFFWRLGRRRSEDESEEKRGEDVPMMIDPSGISDQGSGQGQRER